MTPGSIAIATCRRWPAPSAGLARLIAALRDSGLRVDVQPWQEDVEAFAKAALILPLATWDYAADPDGFAAWLAKVTSMGGRFANPVALMLWNLNKSYLRDLAAGGVPVVPSVLLDHATGAGVQAAMSREGWRHAVVKPAIGQSGHGVARILPDTPLPALPDAPLLLQPYIEGATAGETSLIFVAGRFSHAVRRVPAPGDWRANTGYGASVVATDPSPAQLDLARQALATLAAPPLYARVDLYAGQDGPILAELELIEPALFLDYAAPTATAQLVQELRSAARI